MNHTERKNRKRLIICKDDIRVVIEREYKEETMQGRIMRGGKLIDTIPNIYWLLEFFRSSRRDWDSWTLERIKTKVDKYGRHHTSIKKIKDSKGNKNEDRS